jgi:hypothetical protein
MRRILTWVLALAALFAGVTYFALEGNDVANLRTKDDLGGWRGTHIWVVEDGDSLWAEAATPDRVWLLEAQREPKVEIDWQKQTLRMRAQVVEGEETRERVRAMLAEKYGWAAAYVDLLQDTSSSVMVRFDPRPD